MTIRLYALLAATLALTGQLIAQSEPSPGYTLIAPLGSRDTFLINMDGKVVHQWTSDYQPGNSAYLLEDGSLLRTAKEPNETFNARGGIGGRVQRFSWEGELLWDFKLSDDRYCQHHDIEPMPGGNVLCIAWERKTRQQAIEAGRDPEKLSDEALWPEAILEIEPQGKTGGKIVWRWSMWDHLIQSYDENKANYGQVAEHPELIDLNFVRRGNADWIHMNSVAYNADLDQILMSARWFNEIWIIDHSTTSEQAAGHSGGKYGKGGDLLYRWGNPYAYFAGMPFDQRYFGQHDARWIPKSYPGGGNILVFDNGGERTGRNYSTVEEIKPPMNDDGGYLLDPSGPFGPKEFTWSYSDPGNFLSERISGAERQPNGNTLICSGDGGHVFEVDPDGKIVWEFRNTLGARSGGGPGGGRAGAGRPGAGRPGAGRPGAGRPGEGRPGAGRPGEEGRADGGRPRRGEGDGGPGAGRPGGGLGAGGAGGPGAGGPGGGPRGGGPGGGSMFRAPRYPLDYPAFAGRDL